MGKLQYTIFLLLMTCMFFTKSSISQKVNKDSKNATAQTRDTVKQYQVAAFVWPSCHDDKRAREVLWPQGIGEWEIIQKGKPMFEGHYQPRIPLWGYKMDDDPVAWVQKINAAVDHGINVFIFDWYWYDGDSFLEDAINKGFLGAANNKKAQFYIMWANHDVPHNFWNPYLYDTDELLWNGEIDWDNFKIIVPRIIKQYFKRENYFKINEKPVFAIFSLTELVNSFGSVQAASEALDYFREETKRAGFPGLHIQAMGGGSETGPALGRNLKEVNKVSRDLGLDSVTMYNMHGQYARKDGDYLRYAQEAVKLREQWDDLLDIPFFPVVSIGWDNTPRYPNREAKGFTIYLHNTPQTFATYLKRAKDYADNHPHQPLLIIINAWNEWVEGSYLEPDMKWGYDYLEAVRDVMMGKYDRY
jgi:hypothetical protein